MTIEKYPTHLKAGDLVKLKNSRAGQLSANFWNQETGDYCYRNHVHLPERYAVDDQWAVDYSIWITTEDVGIFIARVDPNPSRSTTNWNRFPIDVILIKEKIVGVEAKRIRPRGYLRSVRYESRLKRVTKRDYEP